MYTKEHVKLLKTIIVDKENVFIARIGCEPRVSDTGIANIIPQGIDRESRDVAIYIAREIVRRWNAYEKGGSHTELLATCKNLVNLLCHPGSFVSAEDIKGAKAAIAEAVEEKPKILFRDGQPCKHKACLNHRSHPCEGCGRIAGRGDITENPFLRGGRRKGKG